MKNKILNIFQEFDTKHLEYCYIRDKKSFDSIFLSECNDIDLVIENDDIKKMIVILEDYDFYNLFGHKCLLHIEQCIYFDLHTSIYERYPLLDISKVIKRRVKSNFYFLNEIDLYKILLLHPMDLSGFRGQRTFTKDKVNYLKEHKSILSKVSPELNIEYGDKFTNRIISYLGNNNFDAIKKDNLKFKFFMYLHNLGYIKYLFQRVKKKIFKSNYEKSKLIIFMGVDGSGKTTTADNTISFMKRYYGNKSGKINYYYLGSQGGYILPLVKVAEFKDKIKAFFTKEKIVKIDKSKTKQVINNTHGKLKEFLLIFEYICRYLKLQYLLKIRNKIVVSDRYLYDYFRTDNTDPKVVQYFSKLFPKPDYIFMMDGDTQKFYDRKKEYSPEILQKHQYDLIYGLDKNNINFYKIDANQNEQEVLKSILKVLSD